MTEAPVDPTPTWSQLLDLVTRLDSSTYADVELEMPGLRLRMSTTALPAAAAPGPAPASSAAAGSGPGTAEPATPGDASSATPAEPPAATPAAGNLVEVTAPMLGTFYRRPSPDADPYVEVGTEVTTDTTVGIVEVMKLMNQVPADVAGTVVEVLAADGDLVEHGQVLVRIDVGGGS